MVLVFDVDTTHSSGDHLLKRIRSSLSLSLSLSWNDSTGRFLVGSLKDIASILLYPIRNDNRIPLDVNEEAKFVPFRSNKS